MFVSPTVVFFIYCEVKEEKLKLRNCFLDIWNKNSCGASFLYFSSGFSTVQRFIVKWPAIFMFPVLPTLKFWWVLCDVLCFDSIWWSRKWGSWSKPQGFGMFCLGFFPPTKKRQMLLLAIRKINTWVRELLKIGKKSSWYCFTMLMKKLLFNLRNTLLTFGSKGSKSELL